MRRRCCCTDCCSTPGGPPTADFVYAQTDDDPCTFNFTSESTGGSCGNPVSFQWLADDVQFSTQENPVGVVLAGVGPWDVTLVVTDEQGCTDSVVMEVVCSGIITGTCGSITYTIPDQVEVNFGAGWSDPGAADCGDCCTNAKFGGVRTLNFVNTDGSGFPVTARHNYELVVADDCGPILFTFSITHACEVVSAFDASLTASVSADCNLIGPDRGVTWADSATHRIDWTTFSETIDFATVNNMCLNIPSAVSAMNA